MNSSFWGGNNEDSFKSNRECKEIFKELIKMDYFHHVEFLDYFKATHCFVPGIYEGTKIQKYKKMNTFIHLANDYLGYNKNEDWYK